MSEATDINDEGQIVGVSYHDRLFDGPRAFIYQNSGMTDLNQLIGSASANFFISSTGGINDRGEIAARANIVSNGVVTSTLHAILLVPTDDGSDASGAGGSTQNLIIPDDVQKQMQQRIGRGSFTVPVKPQ